MRGRKSEKKRGGKGGKVMRGGEGRGWNDNHQLWTIIWHDIHMFHSQYLTFSFFLPFASPRSPHVMPFIFHLARISGLFLFYVVCALNPYHISLFSFLSFLSLSPFPFPSLHSLSLFLTKKKYKIKMWREKWRENRRVGWRVQKTTTKDKRLGSRWVWKCDGLGEEKR